MAWSKKFSTREDFEAASAAPDDVDAAQYAAAYAAAKLLLDSKLIPEAQVDHKSHQDRFNEEGKATVDEIRRAGTYVPAFVPQEGIRQAQIHVALSGHTGGIDEIGVSVRQV